MQKLKLECPFCGSKGVNEAEFMERTGVEIEKTLNWNGELKVILKLGELVIEGQKRTGQDMLDKERLLQLMSEEHQRINEKYKELEENRKNIAKEQKEAFTEIAKQRKELEEKKSELEEDTEKLNKLKEEVIKAESVKLPSEIMNKIEEIQSMAKESNIEVKELLHKMIHNVKTAGTIQETQLTMRLKHLNTGDKIEHLGGKDKEDILIRVEENGKFVGKIKFDSKHTEDWNNKFVEQMKRYLQEEKLDFGIIATTTLPKSAAGSDFYWEKDNILIVNQKYAEAVYLVCRYLLIKQEAYCTEFGKKTALLKESQKKFELVKKVLENASFEGYLSIISEEITKDNKNIDDLENYMGDKVRAFRNTNSKIAKQINMALDNDRELQKALAETSA